MFNLVFGLNGLNLGATHRLFPILLGLSLVSVAKFGPNFFHKFCYISEEERAVVGTGIFRLDLYDQGPFNIILHYQAFPTS